MSAGGGRLRVLFFGGNTAYSAACLRAVSSFAVCGIVLPPEAAGPKASAVRRLKRLFGGADIQGYARDAGVPLLRWPGGGAGGLSSFLRDTGPDIGCVVSVAGEIPPELLNAPALGFISLHPSLLPKYRGPNPWFWQYYYMEKEAGATVQFMDGGTDTGDIIEQSPFPVGLGMEPGLFYNRMAETGAALLKESLLSIAAGRAARTPQPKESPTIFARNLLPGEEIIEWESWPIERAFHVMRGASFGGLRLPGPAFARFLDWRPTRFDKTRQDKERGRVYFGCGGYYAVHREGRIYLRPAVSASGLLKYLSPARGL